MSQMFYYCEKLKSLDLISFNTSNVKNLFNIFGFCKSLESINLSSFNTKMLLICHKCFLIALI